MKEPIGEEESQKRGGEFELDPPCQSCGCHIIFVQPNPDPTLEEPNIFRCRSCGQKRTDITALICNPDQIP